MLVRFIDGFDAELLRAGPSVKPSTMVRPYFPAGQQRISRSRETPPVIG